MENSPHHSLDSVFNEMRAQLDFLVESAKYQNKILKELYQGKDDSPGSN